MAPRRFDRYMVAVGAGTHPKFARLTDSERCAHFLGVLAVAAMSPVRGCLLVGKLPAQAVDVARTAGVSERVARSAMDKLRAVGILVLDDEHSCYRVHDWNDINPSPGAERTRQWRDTRASQNHHASVTNSSPEVKKLRSNEKGSSDDDPQVVALCHRLASHIRRNDPKAKPTPDSDRWQRDMRLLLRDRQGDIAEVERIIDWCQHDPFWQSNILSPAKLRKQFTQLVLRAQQPSSVVAMRQRPNASEMLRAINGGAA